jgi:hypothetical protein
VPGIDKDPATDERPGIDKDQVTDIVVAVVFTALGLLIAVTAWRTPEPFRSVDVLGPNRFPLLVGAGIAILGIFVIVKQVYLAVTKTFQKGSFEIPGQAGDEPDVPASGLRAGIVSALLFGHVLLWETLGFLLSSMLFVIVSMRLMKESSWKLTIGSAVGYTVVMFVMFTLLLGVALPLGFTEPIFVRFGLVDAIR